MMTEQPNYDCWSAAVCTPAKKRFKFSRLQIAAMQLVGAITCSIPLAFTAGDRQIEAGLFAGYPAQAEDLQPYARNGGITQSQIDYLNRSYAKQQSYQAIQSLRRRGELGSPNYTSEFREIYEIKGSDGYHAPQKFHILYRPSPNCNYQCSEAYDWYRQ